MSTRGNGGFTIIEAVISVVLIAVVAGMSVPLLSQTVVSKDLPTSVAEAVDALREAQSAVMSGRGDSAYGVHFHGTGFVFFKGATYSESDPDNVVHALSDIVAITDVALVPGGTCALPAGTGNCDVHFANSRGVAAETGTVTFTDQTDAVKTISLNAAGLVDSD
jgi:type II secretory pathway pseudopilin PulG